VTAPWIAVMVCLWVVVIALVVVVVGVLRRAAAALESLPSGSFSTRDLPMGPPAGSKLPPMAVQGTDGADLTLADLPGPFVLAVLTSHCSPCQSIAEQLRGDPQTLAKLDGMVVLTDPEGPDRLGLGAPLTVLVDPTSQITAQLELPGTPFVLAVNADGTVHAAQLLAGPAQLLSLLDAVRISGELGSAARVGSVS
jgi:AhpC/TSA family